MGKQLSKNNFKQKLQSQIEKNQTNPTHQEPKQTQIPVIKTKSHTSQTIRQLRYIGTFDLPNFINQEYDQLKDLNMSHNVIQDEGISWLIKARWKSLTSLNLNGNQLTAKGINFLIKSPWTFTCLKLSSNKLTDKAIQYLSFLNLEKLETLELCNNKIGNFGVKQIAYMQFSHLENLDLSDNNIKYQGILYLMKLEGKNAGKLSFDAFWLKKRMLVANNQNSFSNHLQEKFPKSILKF